MIIIIYFYGRESQLGLYLLFPMITLMIESKENILARAPLTSFIVDLYMLFSMSQSKIAEIKTNGEEKVGFKYQVPDENSESI